VARDPRELVPLKPLVFQILLALAEGERHGWRLVRDLEQRTDGPRLLTGNFYRLLRSMMAEDLIAEQAPTRTMRTQAAEETGANAERRRYFALTAFGRRVARAEAERLEQLVAESRRKQLLASRAGR
jgi:DNA-binding PadR family transcriptional regulator